MKILNKQPIEINITQNGTFDINLPYGCLVLRVDEEKVEVEQVGHQEVIMCQPVTTKLTDDQILAIADENELFCLFGRFIKYLKVLNPGKYDDIVFLDKEIGTVIHQLQYNIKRTTVEPIPAVAPTLTTT